MNPYGCVGTTECGVAGGRTVRCERLAHRDPAALRKKIQIVRREGGGWLVWLPNDVRSLAAERFETFEDAIDFATGRQ